MIKNNFEKIWLKTYERLAKSDLPDYKKMYCNKKRTVRDIKLFLKLFNNFGKKNSRIFDAGCGTGTYCNILYDQGSIVTGLDYSKNILDIAKKNARGRNIKYIQGSLYNTHMKNNSFDTALCIGALQTVIDYERVIKELARIIDKGGYMCINTLRQPSTIELLLSPLYLFIIGKSISEIRKTMRIMKNRGYLTNNSLKSLVARRFYPYEIKNALIKCGFEEIKIYYSNPFSYRIPLMSDDFFVIAKKK